MDKFHKNYDQETGRAKSLDNIAKVLETFPDAARNLLSTHVVIIVTKDPKSSLPEEMKTYYNSMGVTFGDFPMLNIGKAKGLKDQLPEFTGFPPMPHKEGSGPSGLVLVGEDYYMGNKKIGYIPMGDPGCDFIRPPAHYHCLLRGKRDFLESITPSDNSGRSRVTRQPIEGLLAARGRDGVPA